jgi:squalene-associated FAD-dependent desaturase
LSDGDSVLVLGGGLAGITAALDCAEAGANVTLVEVRRRLGGAAYSVLREGLEMDNGQHVFLRGCLAYRGLLRRLGSEHLTHVQPRLEIPVLKPGHETFMLRRSSLPAPLHLAGALARYPHLTHAQRLGAARAALGLMRMDARTERLDQITLGEWLARHGQDAAAVAALWDLIALPTLNIPAAEASLALGVFVFRRGLLTSSGEGDIGFHVGTLQQIIGEPALATLRRAGVDVRMGWRAEHVRRGGSRLEVQGTGGREDAAPAGTERLGADAVVMALPHARAAGILAPEQPLLAARVARLGASPIVNVHVVYDRTVCEHRFAAGVGTPVQYIFDRTAAGGAPAGCQYLAVSLSGAEREMKMGVPELRELYTSALQELLPRAREAKIESFLVTREHAATFRATPGVGALRPGPRTDMPGLVLAGAWTDTGWPATLESAVLSGHAAAAQVRRELGLEAPSNGTSSGSVPEPAQAPAAVAPMAGGVGG